MPSETAWQVSTLLPKSATDALAVSLIIIGLVLALCSLIPGIRSHALRIAGISSVLSLALFANVSWTYFATIFIVATVITELEFLQNLAAIIARDPNYWQYKAKPATGIAEIPKTGRERLNGANGKSSMELKILNTLWTLQAHHHPELDASVTFTIQVPTSRHVDPQYAEYLTAVGKLMQANLLTESDNKQVCLTFEGLTYCAEHYKEFPSDRWYFDEVPIDAAKRERLMNKIMSIAS